MKPLAILLSIAMLSCVAVSGQIGGDEERRKKRRKSNKKDIEPVTQVLPLPKDLPNAIVAETQKLVFHVSPLSGKGLLSQQTRDAIKALWSLNKGAPIVKLRAFVAGSGDTRRVATIVSETFTERKAPLPVLTTVLVGSLGMEGAQILIEATSVERKAVNPHGLMFVSGKAGKDYRETMEQVRTAVKAAGGAETDILRVTCYVNNFDSVQPDRQLTGSTASYTVVQMRREPSPTPAECEAIAKLAAPQAEPVKLINPPAFTASPNFSQIATVSAPRIVFSGLQLAFQSTDADVKLAFDRLGKTLESSGVKYRDVFMTSIYALTQQAIDRAREVRFQYLDKSRPPASTLLPFEGLPSLDATLGLDVVAALP
jgi:enamine deaminase RidA (YjgF/YER057c/UK114 family)